MASSLSHEETGFVSVLHDKKDTNPFSESWEDSDLVLVVENERFHVHRQILSIHSPVFKAMLSTQFKKAEAKEIPLPEKKADEVLNFLKQLYMKDRDEIALDKVEHLLRLADEYQTKSVFDVCLNYLKVLPGSKENAVRTLFLTNMTAMARGDRRLDIVRSGCYNLIKDMSLQDIVKKDDFKNLERDSVESVLVERVKKLEGLVEVVYPQLIGLVEFCLVLCLGPKKQNAYFRSCPEHFNSNHMALEELYTRIKKCTTCRRMIEQLVSHSQQVKSQKYLGPPTISFSSRGTKGTYKDAKLEHLYGGSHHFDSKLVSVIQDFYKAYKVIASTKASLAVDFTGGASQKLYFSTSFPFSDFGE